MQGGTHIAVALAAGSVIMTGNPAGIVAAGIGAVFPDIDSRHSVIGRKIPFLWLIGGRHRGWTHSILGLIIFSLPLWLLSKEIFIGFALGYITHLLLDMLNPSGVRVFWPIPLTVRLSSISSTDFLWNFILTTVFTLIFLSRLLLNI
jgi:inner membrane protein